MSDYSPGAVQHDEVLIRTVYSPVQINKETGSVDPVHFRHDALERGLSVNRKGHTSEPDLRARIDAKIARDIQNGKPRDGFYRVVTARTGDIRGLVGDDGRRQFCVYDTARDDDVSHADVCLASDPPPKTPNRKHLRMKICSRLSDIFIGEAVELATVYSGDD